jgi:hypothetical protein
MRVVAGVMCAVASVVMAATPGVAVAETEDRIPALEAGTSAADACNAAFPNDAFAHAPSEGTVTPGQRFSVDVTWRTAWHEESTVDVVGCVASDGRFDPDGSTLARGVENNGLYVHHFTVPEGSANDATICEAAVIIGRAHGGALGAERSGPDCFTVAASSRTAAGAEPAAAVSEPTTTPGEDAPAARHGPPAAQSQAGVGWAGQAQPQTPSVMAGATTSTPSAAPPALAPSAPAARPAELGRTGARDRILVLVAGLMFILGGLTIGVGRPDRRHA